MIPASSHLAADVIEAPKIEVPIPGVTLTSITNPNDYSIPWVSQYIGGIYTFVIGTIGVVAAVMMVIGGFQYLTSAGDKGRVGKGRKRIVDAMIGLVLALGSYVILYTLNPALVAFKGLSLIHLQTETYGAALDVPSGADSTTPAVPLPPNTTGGRTSICNDVNHCLPFCQAAGCTRVFCFSGEAPPPGFTCIGDPWQNNCQSSKFPTVTASDILPPNAPELRSASLWPKMANILANSGVSASQLVIDGLQRANRYIDEHYAGQGYKIRIHSCWRDYRADFGAQCAIIMRTTWNDPQVAKSTWPGGNPHSAGYACDLHLEQRGSRISGLSGDQMCASKGTGNQLLVDILTNATVGARRLNYEAWHFNWAGWNSCFCTGSECENHLYPSATICGPQTTPRSSC